MIFAFAKQVEAELIDANDYEVIVTREGASWLADVPAVPGAQTFARSLAGLAKSVREVLGGPAHTWMTARDAAEAIKGELATGDDDFALRTLVGAINDFRRLRDPGEIQEFLRRPRPTGDRRWDTLIAAAVARACRPRGVTPPKWTRRAPLESWWFPADGGGLLAARTMARTPIDFSRLGIWLDASAFQTA